MDMYHELSDEGLTANLVALREELTRVNARAEEIDHEISVIFIEMHRRKFLKRNEEK